MSIIKRDHSDLKNAKAIKNQISKLPSDLFLWAALGSMGASATLKCLGRKHTALFIGQWTAPLLLLGIYNKLIKIKSSECEAKQKFEIENYME